MRTEEKRYEDLKFTDNFIFIKVMENEEICKKLLQLILCIEIDRIEYVETERSFDTYVDARGVRLDVFAKDGEGTIYNVEMQSTNTKELPKRSRYYQSNIDLSLLEKGVSYRALSKSYVVFICMEDLFGGNRHVYTFQNICLQDNEISLADETYKVFINPISTRDDITLEMENFLKYLVEGTPTDDFTKEIDNAVRIAKKNKEWRREYMTLHQQLIEWKIEGLEEGREEGEARLSQLITKLLEDGRHDDMELALKDVDARQNLYAEYSM